jgi:hypothetical protein
MRCGGGTLRSAYAAAGMFCSDFGSTGLMGTIGGWISSMSKLTSLYRPSVGTPDVQRLSSLW